MKPATLLNVSATATAAIAQMTMNASFKSAKMGVRTMTLSLLLASRAKPNPK
jgi:hypothetical protein